MDITTTNYSSTSLSKDSQCFPLYFYLPWYSSRYVWCQYLGWQIGNAKITTRDNWDSIRIAGEEVTWHKAVWIKNGITRYAFYHWFLCRGRLYTLMRLQAFGIITSVSCYLCEGSRRILTCFFIVATLTGFLSSCSNLLTSRPTLIELGLFHRKHI